MAEDVEGSSRRKSFVPGKGGRGCRGFESRKSFVPHTPPQGALYTHDPALSVSGACSGSSDVKKREP